MECHEMFLFLLNDRIYHLWYKNCSLLDRIIAFSSFQFHIYMYKMVLILIITRKTSTTPSCNGPIPAQRIWGNFCTRAQGCIFPHNAQNGFLRFPSFSFVKSTLNWYITCHGYFNNHQSPFMCPIKNYRKFGKVTPLALRRSWNEMYLFPS